MPDIFGAEVLLNYLIYGIVLTQIGLYSHRRTLDIFGAEVLLNYLIYGIVLTQIGLYSHRRTLEA